MPQAPWPDTLPRHRQAQRRGASSLDPQRRFVELESQAQEHALAGVFVGGQIAVAQSDEVVAQREPQVLVGLVAQLEAEGLLQPAALAVEQAGLHAEVPFAVDVLYV